MTLEPRLSVRADPRHRPSSLTAATTATTIRAWSDTALGFAMLTAFIARPVVEFRQRDKSKIESVLAYGMLAIRSHKPRIR